MMNSPRIILSMLIGSMELAFLLIINQRLGNGSSSGQDFMALVCSAGTSLFLVVLAFPLVWFMGEATSWLLLPLFDVLGKQGLQAEPLQAGDAAVANRSARSLRVELMRYVERKHAAGLPLDELIAKLRRAGWDDSTIAAVMRGVDDR